MHKHSMPRKPSGLFRVALFAITFAIFFSCCFLYNNHDTVGRETKTLAELPEQINHKSISAVVLTSLPFVLAVKNLIVDREEK